MRRLRLIAPLLVLATRVSSLPAGIPPPDGSDAARDRGTALVREMITAAGGLERWNAIRDASFVLRTTAFDADPSGSRVTSIQARFTKAPRPMLRVDFPDGKNIQTKVFDGLEAWLAIDGVLLRRGDSTYRRIRDSARKYFLWIGFPFNLVDAGTTFEYLGTEGVVGQEVEILQVRFGEPSGTVSLDDLYRFAVSRLTHLTVREEYFLRGERENLVETLYSDYRAEAGIVKDHVREIVSSVNQRPLQRIEVQKLQFGDHLARDLFRKPTDPMTEALPRE